MSGHRGGTPAAGERTKGHRGEDPTPQDDWKGFARRGTTLTNEDPTGRRAMQRQRLLRLGLRQTRYGRSEDRGNEAGPTLEAVEVGAEPAVIDSSTSDCARLHPRLHVSRGRTLGTTITLMKTVLATVIALASLGGAALYYWRRSPACAPTAERPAH